MKKITIMVTLSLLVVGMLTATETESVFVSGTGIVTLEPDTASITFAVVTRDKKATTAANENARIMSMVHESLIKSGIEKDNITTNNYSLYQESEYNSRNQQTTYKDYRVSNNVSVIVNNIDDVGDVIDTALKAGVNSLVDVSFYAKNTEEAHDEARKLAVQEALATASLLAEAAGRTTGTVLNIFENSGNGGAYWTGNGFNGYARKDMAMAESLSYTTPIAPGSTEISVTVSLIVALH